MKNTVTIILIISTLGLIITGLAIPENAHTNSAIAELHGMLSLIFSICLFFHLRTHLKTFIRSFKTRDNE